MKPTILRALAQDDVALALTYYLEKADADVAMAFVAALETALQSIADTPVAGSTRWSVELNLPGLRSKRLKRFPYVVFYVERAEHIDIWRVLHAVRDIPSSMQEEVPDDRT